jgi:hypothetical protein
MSTEKLEEMKFIRGCSLRAYRSGWWLFVLDLHVDTTTLTVDDDILRLTTIEASGDLAVLALTLVTATGGLTLA